MTVQSLPFALAQFLRTGYGVIKRINADTHAMYGAMLACEVLDVLSVAQ